MSLQVLQRSPFFIGPRAGSYKPPAVGVCVLSRRTGFVSFLTDMALISSDERKEKDVPAMLDDIGLLISMMCV